MTDSILGDTCPNDGRVWRVQCARCGSSVDIHGDGYVCAASSEWCEAHPLEDRRSIKRGPMEFFTHEPRRLS